MEKLKTYWFNKNNRAKVQLIGLLFFIFYGVLTLLFYKERTLSFDSAGFIFELIQTKNFVLPLGRWGSLFSQIIPLIFIKSGASLEVVLKVFSFNFTLLYYLGFLIITLLFKNFRIGLVYLLTLCLAYRNTFYFSVSEFSQGLALVVVLYGLLIYTIGQQSKNKQNIFFVFALILAIVLYYFHQLLIIPITFVFCLVILKYKVFKNWKLYAALVITIIWYVINLMQLPKDSYESDKIKGVDVFIEQIPSLFNLPSFKYFSFFFQNELIIVTAIFCVCLIFLMVKKHWLLFGFFLLSPLAYLILITITYYKGEGPNMYEQYFIVFGFFAALLIGLVIKEKGLTKPILLATILLISYSSYKMYEAHKPPTKRLAYLTKLVEIGQKHPNKKYIIPSGDYFGVYAWAGWAFPVETLLASSLEDKNNGVTIYVQKENEALKLNLNNGDLYSVPWLRGLLNTKVLDTNYFKIPETTDYLMFKKLKRDKYYFYELIKYDVVWMEKIIKQAEEDGVTLEENIWRNAEYVVNNQ